MLSQCVAPSNCDCIHNYNYMCFCFCICVCHLYLYLHLDTRLPLRSANNATGFQICLRRKCNPEANFISISKSHPTAIINTSGWVTFNDNPFSLLEIGKKRLPGTTSRLHKQQFLVIVVRVYKCISFFYFSPFSIFPQIYESHMNTSRCRWRCRCRDLIDRRLINISFWLKLKLGQLM